MIFRPEEEHVRSVEPDVVHHRAAGTAKWTTPSPDTSEYAPATGTGIFFLGVEPRDYFDDPQAHDPVDREREAGAFVEWAARIVGVEVDAADVLSLMARPEAEEPRDVFVEDTVVELLNRLDLPLPHELTDEPTNWRP